MNLKILRGGFVLLGLSLLVLQLALCSQASAEDLRFTLLGGAALCGLVWTRRRELKLESGPLATVIGVLLIGLVLSRTLCRPDDLFATLAPIPWGAGLVLIASGWRGSLQYWREAIIVGATVVTPFTQTFALDLLGIDLSPNTAAATASLLRLGGWPATSHEMLVGLPTRWVIVSQGCSGLKTMYFLAGFAAIVLLIHPLPGLLRKVVVVAGAAAIGFIVNTLRVALLVLLAGPEHQRAFAFWHIKQGSMLVEVVAIIAFIAFFSWLIPARRARPDISLP